MTSTYKERRAYGKARRDKCAKDAHAPWKPHPKRRDPIDLLIESSAGRMQQLVPIRYGRMMQSPFAFYREAAAIMAADLAHTRTYAEQNERDYKTLLKAIREGRIPTLEE